jgi:Holliday junction resolvase RusA-like endonuclease
MDPDMTTLTFTAWGRPVGQGNHVQSRWGATYEKTKGHAEWRAELIGAARAAMANPDTNGGRTWQALDGPVDVEITFYGPRANGHYGTGRNADTLKPSAPPYPLTGGGSRLALADIDKLCRSVLDALTLAEVIVDDSRVVDLTARKRYAAQPAGARAIIDVRPHEEPTP